MSFLPDVAVVIAATHPNPAANQEAGLVLLPCRINFILLPARLLFGSISRLKGFFKERERVREREGGKQEVRGHLWCVEEMKVDRR